MLRKIFFIALAAIGCLTANHARADIIAVVVGSDAEALTWLAIPEIDGGLGVTGLDFLVKHDLEENDVVGPAAGDWFTDAVADGRSGSWAIDSPLFSPQYSFIKFGKLIAIYEADGPNPHSFDLDVEVWSPISKALQIDLRDENNNIVVAAGTVSPNGNYSGLNASAGTGHISVYGSVNAIPEPGTATICLIGIVGLAGGALRRRHRV